MNEFATELADVMGQETFTASGVIAAVAVAMQRQLEKGNSVEIPNVVKMEVATLKAGRWNTGGGIVDFPERQRVKAKVLRGAKEALK